MHIDYADNIGGNYAKMHYHVAVCLLTSCFPHPSLCFRDFTLVLNYYQGLDIYAKSTEVMIIVVAGNNGEVHR